MGGDHAPAEVVAGALKAQEELGVEVLLVGDPQQIEDSLRLQGAIDRVCKGQLEIVPSEGTV